jgi:tryptophan synthase alpha chain
MRGIYIVGGYPDREGFKERFVSVADCGYDFIEVGLPFNDPVADGPVIAEAINRSLERGATIDGIIDDVIKLKGIGIKKYIMTYSNIVYSYGISAFSSRLKEYIDGIIIADLPNRMMYRMYDGGFEIPIIPFATLETRISDIELIKRSKGDFIYFVGIRGITGGKADFASRELLEKIKMLRGETDKKIVIGFGIKTADDVKMAMEISDGFVVGTESVRRQESSAEFTGYIKSLMAF